MRHLFVRVIAGVVWLTAALLPAAADNAAKIYEDGRKAERAGHMAEAYLLYSQAAALNPTNQLYWLKSQAVESRAALESPPKIAPGSAKAQPGTTATVNSAFDELSLKDQSDERSPQPPKMLHGRSGVQDFDLRADAKSLWVQVAHAFALDAVFDADYQPSAPVHFQLTAVDYRSALHAAEAATGSFVVPVSGRLFLVVKDTEQKRREMEPTVAATIPIPVATTAPELVEIGQAVRQLFTLEHMAWDAQQNRIVLRDRISRVVPARQVLEELLHHRPQVDVEVELLELDRTYSLAYGLDLPAAFPLVYMGGFWNHAFSLSSSISKLLTFGGGQTLFGIGIADASLVATMSKAFAHTLVRTDVRALDGLPASLHVGDRFPVLSAGYFGPPGASTGGTVYTPPPAFTFEDLGVNVKLTPHIHGMDEVTLELETEFKVLSGQSSNGIPIISSRHLTSKMRLREGQWGVVAGLMNSTEARTIQGIAGLASMPVLGQLFRHNNKDETSTEVLMIIKPTLLNLPADQFVTPAIWTGPDARPVTPL